MDELQREHDDRDRHPGQQVHARERAQNGEGDPPGQMGRLHLWQIRTPEHPGEQPRRAGPPIVAGTARVCAERDACLRLKPFEFAAARQVPATVGGPSRSADTEATALRFRAFPPRTPAHTAKKSEIHPVAAYPARTRARSGT
ncbi:hypothetical protein Pve01_40720 [Planomonospora venezuelensis]|nr:hypothetical protein Pve01_40720 [Planomonospora venezuelensis]